MLSRAKSLNLLSKKVHSPYLVQNLAKARPGVYDYVKWRTVSRLLRAKDIDSGPVLDFGCAHQPARHWLEKDHPQLSYVGIDREYKFRPDIVGDVREISSLANRLPSKPQAVLLMDILEHLEGKEEDINGVLESLNQTFPKGTRILIGAPHLYRLDALKLKHLHYPEHKVRFKSSEWRQIISKHLNIQSEQAMGLISTLPYLIMFYRGYQEKGRTGQIFRFLRNTALNSIPGAKTLDYMLSRVITKVPKGEKLSNAILFECFTR